MKLSSTLLRRLVPLGLWLPLATSSAAQNLPGPGNCYTFNGVSTAISCGVNNRGLSQQVTAEAWIRTTTTDYQLVVEKYVNSTGDEAGFHLLTINGLAGFNGRAQQGQYFSSGLSTTRVDDGRWHHLAGVFTGTTWQIYVDGQLENSTTFTVAGTPNLTNTRPLNIGSYGAQSGQYFRGQIDEVRVWNTARTVQELRDNMCRKFSTAPASLVGYYRFDETSGSTVIDAGAVPTDGTPTGLPVRAASGAALGDASQYTYAPTSTPLTLAAASGDQASVSALSTGTQGVHLYAVNSAPTTTPDPGAASTYFGVFTLPSSSTYTVALIPQNSASVSRALYSRPSGEASWTTTAPTRNATTLTLTGQTDRGEYILGIQNTWTGNVSTTYTAPANWSAGFVPGPYESVVIPAGAVRMPVLSAAAAAASFSVASGASMTVDATGTLTLNGPLMNNGTFTGLGTLQLSGFSPNSRLTGSSPISIGNLNVGNGSTTGSQALTVETPLSIRRVLTLSDNLTPSGAGSLTLVSDNLGTAMVVNNGSARVIGTATVQRYIDGTIRAGVGYRHLSAPVTNTTVLDLQTSTFPPVVNVAYNTTADPDTITPYPTVYSYDQTRIPTTRNDADAFEIGWLSPASTADALVWGRGYSVNMLANQTVDFVGTLGNGNLIISGLGRHASTQSGWHLIGNPYPSPILWSQIYPASSGLNNEFYIYKANGQYSGTFVNGVGTNNASLTIPLGQAFFVRTNTVGGTGTINLSNSVRATTYSNELVQRPVADTRPLLRLQLRDAAATAADAADEVVLYMQPGATTGFDNGLDAHKLDLGEPTLLTIQQGVEPLSISGLPLPTATPLAVPLGGRVSQLNATYTLHAAEVLNLPAGVTALLHDALTGTLTDLAKQSSYAFTTTSTDLAGRFTVVFGANRTLAQANAQQAQVALYPNPAQRLLFLQLPVAAQPAAVTVDFYNTLGQRAFGQTVPAASGTLRLALPQLKPGIYTVHVGLATGTVTKKVVVE